MFRQIVGFCTLNEASFFLWEELRKREDILNSGVREESVKEEGGRAMQFRVHATGVGCLGQSVTGEGAKTRGLGRTVECRLLSHNRTGPGGMHWVRRGSRGRSKIQIPKHLFVLTWQLHKSLGWGGTYQQLPRMCCSPAPPSAQVPRSGRAAATGESLPPCGHYSNNSLGVQDAPADTVGCFVFFLPVYSELGKPWFE